MAVTLLYNGVFAYLHFSVLREAASPVHACTEPFDFYNTVISFFCPWKLFLDCSLQLSNLKPPV